MTELKPLVINADEGRHYKMGRMSARFVADGEETGSRLSVSEWWLEPKSVGSDVPPAHSHPEDHLFFVIEGEVNIQLDSEWSIARAGAYIYIPGGTEHAFENRSSSKSGFMSINTPGGFENSMPAIVDWFKQGS